MQAAVMRAFREPPILTTVPDPTPPDGGVLIRVAANGICRSDYHALMGHDLSITLPHVPGHELSGTIAALGRGVAGWEIGARVTVPFSCGCGGCPTCLEGFEHLCDNEYQPGFSGWGAFAEYVAVPYAEVNLVRLPESLGFVETASLGCRFMTAFHALTAQARVKAGETVAVHGCGGVGLSAVMIAAALGCRVIAIDLDADKLELARRVGAEAVIRAEQPVEATFDVSAGGAHVSLDALGSAATSRNSVLSLRKKGRHVQIGLLIGEKRPVPLPWGEVISRELEVYGSHGMPAHAYPEMLKMIVSGALEPRKLIAKTVTLAEAGAELLAMGTFAQRGVTVIDFQR